MAKKNVEVVLASKGLLWALFCATKVDHREDGLTKDEALKMLNAANKKSGWVKEEAEEKPSPKKAAPKKSAAKKPVAKKAVVKKMVRKSA